MHANLDHTNQTAVDFSEIVTTNMRSQYPSNGTNWQMMDIRALSFPDDRFDVCIDKATLDAMLYGSLWDPEPEVRANIEAYRRAMTQYCRGDEADESVGTSTASPASSSLAASGCTLPGDNRTSCVLCSSATAGIWKSKSLIRTTAGLSTLAS